MPLNVNSNKINIFRRLISYRLFCLFSTFTLRVIDLTKLSGSTVFTHMSATYAPSLSSIIFPTATNHCFYPLYASGFEVRPTAVVMTSLVKLNSVVMTKHVFSTLLFQINVKKKHAKMRVKVQ